MFNKDITTIFVDKKEKDQHIEKSNKNGWKVKTIENHNKDKNLLIITYTRQ